MYKGPFSWWVQSVMPLVFDDSLSYYEVLAKLTKYIEGLTGDVKEIEKVLETIEGIGDVTEFTRFLETIQAEIGNISNLQTENKSNLVSAINELALKAQIAYYKQPGGIPESDLSEGVRDKLNKSGESAEYIINNKTLKKAPSNNSPADLGLGTYSVPDGGIPWDTLSKDVQDRIDAGGGGTGGTKDYTELINKPEIDGHTLNAGNNTHESLGLGTYTKPIEGIPESDLSQEVQNKLNTSGGIADDEAGFVATRDYEAGELIYINGVLYKTKYKILSGTNLIPGNNIEQTDISSEIEKINSDIEALQSGSGPDSWSLVYNINRDGTTTEERFFEYFNAIGGENYLFICTPNPTQTTLYQIRIYKRDGTLVHNAEVRNYQNQYRFTFTPVNTGEYYCTNNPVGGPNAVTVRVELEYTESQGISELWAQVNKANQLEPTVSALEELTNEQQNNISDLKSAFKHVNNDSRFFAEQGNLRLDDGLEEYNAERIRTGYIKFDSYPATVSAASGYTFRFITYNSNFEIGTNSQNWETSKTFNNANIYLRFVVKKTSGGIITPSELSAALNLDSIGAYCTVLDEQIINKIEYENEKTCTKIFETSLKNRLYTPIELIPGYYIPLSSTYIGAAAQSSGGVYSYIMIRCAPGDQFILNTSGGETPRAYGFARDNGAILEVAEANKTYENTLITAPTNASFLAINNKGTGVSYRVGHSITQKEIIKDITAYGNIGYYNATNTPVQFNYNNSTRISNGEYIYFNKGDAIQIVVGDEYKYVIRMYEGTLHDFDAANYERNGIWTTGSNIIIAPCNGFAAIMFADSADDTINLDIADFNGNIRVIEKCHAESFILKEEAILEQESGEAYSWWVTNRTIDSFGNLYYGYISKSGFCCVGQRKPDGTNIHKRLWKSTNCNDHNAPSVNIIKKGGKEYVIVIGATGQQGDNIIHVCTANKPNTIQCDFTSTPYAITLAEGYKATATYSQCFVNGAKIYNVFNLHQISTTTWEDLTVKVCMKSSDYGETWKLYRLYYDATQSHPEFDYIWLADVEGSSSLKRILVSHNPQDGYYPISTGFINFDSNIIYDGSMNDINKPMTEVESGEIPYAEGTTIAGYSDFTVVVEPSTGFKTRPLDVFETDNAHLALLYCKSATENSDTDFILYRYVDGITTEIGHLGRPFYVPSSYVTGANFLHNINCIVYSRNNSGFSDGAHSLQMVKINNNAIVSDEKIKVTSMCIARPMRFKREGLMYMIGKYYAFPNMPAFLTWGFNIGFIEA